MAMLSRVAHHLYWMMRYLERAENTARLINVNGSLVLDLPKHARPGWSSLIAITGCAEIFYDRYQEPSERNVVKFLIGDDLNSSSILSSLHCARENARSIRGIIPRESWEQINELFLRSKENLASGLSIKQRFAYLKEIILGVQQITGILAGCMSHDSGYEFMRIGRNLERADMTTRIIDVRCEDMISEQGESLNAFENILWMSVLRSLAAYQMYRRHRASVRSGEVIEFLLQDPEFPRSCHFCLTGIRSCLQRLPPCPECDAILLPLQETIQQTEPQKLDTPELHAFIDGLQISLAEVHTAVSTRYFEGSTERKAA